jgi:hypothetical protein
MEELEQFFEGLKEDLDEMQMGIEEERQGREQVAGRLRLQQAATEITPWGLVPMSP